jgi:hypothetical protein
MQESHKAITIVMAGSYYCFSAVCEQVCLENKDWPAECIIQ